MTERLLHALAIPSDAQTSTRAQVRRNVSKSGVLSGGTAVEPVSLEPGERLLQGSYRAALAELSTTEIEELFDADIEYVPFVARDGADVAQDGYYSLENVTAQPADPRAGGQYRFDGTLTKAGTRSSHRRTVRVKPQDAVNPWGSGTGETVAVSGRAREQQWYHPPSGALEPATPTDTTIVEGRPDGTPLTVDVYDLTDASFYDPADSDPDVPVLVYDEPLAEEFWTDCAVWDTYGREKTVASAVSGATVGSSTVGSASVGGTEYTVTNQWQRVYRADHQFRGAAVLDSGALRLRFDEDVGSLTAERARGPYNEWAAEPLRASTWAVRDLDVRRVGLARVDAVVTFVDSSDGAVAAVELSLGRGDTRALITRSANGDAIPSGLVDALTPVAASTDRATAPTAGLVARTDLR